MHFKCLPIVFLILFFSGLAQAGDEQAINQALETNSIVTLQPVVYNIEGSIILHSGNILQGEPGTILKVSANSDQWFVDGTGIIDSNEPDLHDIEISNIEIDGNCQNLPQEFANSGNGDHNSERLIDLRGSTDQFLNNITIHDLKLYDAFSDGVHIAFANNVNCYRIFGSNCQHDTLYYVNVLSGNIYSNEIAGITSDCIRLDNCQKIKVFDNILYSYSGDHNNGAYKNGENGLQAGDQGFSHGGGSEKPNHTQDIEIYNNTFANNGLRAIWLDAAGKEPSDNVWIHDNNFVDISGLETSGYTFNNQPPKELSENIFDILKQAFSFSYPDIQADINASVDISYYNNSYNPHSLIYVSGEGLTGVKYEYAGLSANHYYSINGESADLWTGGLQHKGNAVYLNGSFDAAKLQIICYNSQGYSRITDFNITEVPEDSKKVFFNPQLWAFVGTLLILSFSIYRNFKRIVVKW